MIAAVGEGVRGFAVGDRVMAFHHIPCRECYYCRHKVFAQCEVYKRVGCTAGFEPAGGGFAEYVRVMDWIVARGLVKIPDDVSYEQASFIEPVNTCMKGHRDAAPGAGRDRAGDGTRSDRTDTGVPGPARGCTGDNFRFVRPAAYNSYVTRYCGDHRRRAHRDRDSECAS